MNQSEATGERELGVGELNEGVLRVAAYRSQCLQRTTAEQQRLCYNRFVRRCVAKE